MRSRKPPGLVSLHLDRAQLVRRHLEGGFGEGGRPALGLAPYRAATDLQVESIQLPVIEAPPYASFSSPRPDLLPPAVLRRGGSIASAAIHIGIVALLVPVGAAVESSFFSQHMVYLIPLDRPAPVEIEPYAGARTGLATAGAGAISPGMTARSAALTPGMPVGSPVVAQPANGPPAKRTNRAGDVAIAPTLQMTRILPLRTETARLFRSEIALTEIAVRNAAVRDPASPAPEFPARLLATGVSGEVTARFVVDTLGIVDVASYTVVRSNRAEFSDAVRRALPKMRFRPATQRGRLVRQWVEQTFHFRVQRTETALTKNEVDNPVERDLGSPEPEFPAPLLAAGIAGQVTARFVVDTMGVIDTTTYTVVQSSRREFEDAVRGALPGMRFTPATQGGRLVRQWVEQTFHFRIQRKPE